MARAKKPRGKGPIATKMRLRQNGRKGITLVKAENLKHSSLALSKLKIELNTLVGQSRSQSVELDPQKEINFTTWHWDEINGATLATLKDLGIEDELLRKKIMDEINDFKIARKMTPEKGVRFSKRIRDRVSSDS